MPIKQIRTQLTDKSLPKLSDPEYFQLAKQGADQSDPLCLRILGECHLSGRGIRTNYTVARMYLTKAFSLGDKTSRALLGMMLVKGLGGEQQIPQGTALILEVASTGECTQLLKLAKDYLTGTDCIAQDAGKAVNLFEEAVAQTAYKLQKASAYYGIARCIEVMGQDCLEDPRQTPQHFYTLSACHGHPNAMRKATHAQASG